MRSRWQKRRHPDRDVSGVGLVAVEQESPLARLRVDGDGDGRRRRRGRRWFRPLPLVAVVLVVLALVGYLSVYRQMSRRTPVLVAARALAAGTVVRAADLSSAGLAGGTRVLATFIPAGEEGVVVGRTLKSAVASGTPIPQAALAAPGHSVASMTLAVPVLHALAGDLEPGDRVTVLATFTTATGGSFTRVVARNLPVLAIGTASGFDASSQTIPVTVELAAAVQASGLALANEAGKLDLIREPATGSTAPIPSASTAQVAP